MSISASSALLKISEDCSDVLVEHLDLVFTTSEKSMKSLMSEERQTIVTALSHIVAKISTCQVGTSYAVRLIDPSINQLHQLTQQVRVCATAGLTLF